jgi:hypothetical protein
LKRRLGHIFPPRRRDYNNTKAALRAEAGPNPPAFYRRPPTVGSIPLFAVIALMAPSGMIRSSHPIGRDSLPQIAQWFDPRPGDRVDRAIMPASMGG